MSSTDFIYLVFPIPIITTTDKNWFKCHRDPPTSGSGNCASDEYCYAIGTFGLNQTCQCAGVTDTVVATYGCAKEGLTSVYDYLGGNYLNPGLYTYIPGIGNNPSTGKPYYPMDLPNPTDTLMGDYAGIAYPGMYGSSGGGTNPGYIIVAYQASWFTGWTDLDKIAPPGVPFKGTNGLIQNTVTNSNNPFYVQTSAGQGPPVPSIEQQFVTLLQNFCGQTSVAPSICPADVNNGSGTCSNFLTARTDNGPNYCNIAMQNDRVVNGLPLYGMDGVIASYCNSFAGNTVDPIPPECYCQEPTAVPNNAFNEILGLFANPGQGNPVIPAGQGNLNCWWQPCMVPQQYLIPSAELPGTTTCPSICQEITQLVASGGGNIIINNSTIRQNLNCCSSSTVNGSNCTSGPPPPPPSGTCTSDSDCASGQECINNNCSTPSGASCSDTVSCPSGQSCVNGTCYSTASSTCSSDSQCPSGQSCVSGTCTKESFWDKYKVFILVALFIVVFAIILLILLWIFK